jgi:enterochelin esterase-like enzyme
MSRHTFVLLFLLVVASCERRGAQENSARNNDVTHRKSPLNVASSSAVLAPPKPKNSGVSKTLEESEGSELRPREAMEELTWTFQNEAFGRLDVVVVLPDRKPGERFPLLIALHGRGEAMKGPARGARGWVDDYALMRGMQRLGNPPLTSRDFEGFVTAERLETLNNALSRQPYEGLVVLCPYTPDVLAGDRPFEGVKPFTQFLTEVLIPKAKKELPVLGTLESIGIDGVSLGGRVSILSGLYAPEQFHVVAGLQAAFDSDDAPRLGMLGDDAVRRNPGMVFRFLTSERDYFLEANQALALEFERRKHPSKLRMVPGPHDYAFNRGPGALEMLFFHDRILRKPGWPE